MKPRMTWILILCLLLAPACGFAMEEPEVGPAVGHSIKPILKDLVKEYYELMGWDTETGVPLPDTLKKLGLDEYIADAEEQLKLYKRGKSSSAVGEK